MKSPEPGFPSSVRRDVSEAAQPLIALLHRLCETISMLHDDQYVQKPVGVIESSIGGHVRHCLDHVRALLDAVSTGQLSYDHRQRGTAIESSRTAVFDAIEQFAEELRSLPANAVHFELVMNVLMTPDRPPLEVKTTVGRELAYVLAHTVHHNALIAAMVKTLGGWLPDRFGYAPSTIKNLGTKLCVR